MILCKNTHTKTHHQQQPNVMNWILHITCPTCIVAKRHWKICTSRQGLSTCKYICQSMNIAFEGTRHISWAIYRTDMDSMNINWAIYEKSNQCTFSDGWLPILMKQYVKSPLEIVTLWKFSMPSYKCTEFLMFIQILQLIQINSNILVFLFLQGLRNNKTWADPHSSSESVYFYMWPQ